MIWKGWLEWNQVEVSWQNTINQLHISESFNINKEDS
jgi:hypothetical protein